MTLEDKIEQLAETLRLLKLARLNLAEATQQLINAVQHAFPPSPQKQPSQAQLDAIRAAYNEYLTRWEAVDRLTGQLSQQAADLTKP